MLNYVEWIEIGSPSRDSVYSCSQWLINSSNCYLVGVADIKLPELLVI